MRSLRYDTRRLDRSESTGHFAVVGRAQTWTRWLEQPIRPSRDAGDRPRRIGRPVDRISTGFRARNHRKRNLPAARVGRSARSFLEGDARIGRRPDLDPRSRERGGLHLRAAAAPPTEDPFDEARRNGVLGRVKIDPLGAADGVVAGGQCAPWRKTEFMVYMSSLTRGGERAPKPTSPGRHARVGSMLPERKIPDSAE